MRRLQGLYNGGTELNRAEKLRHHIRRLESIICQCAIDGVRCDSMKWLLKKRRQELAEAEREQNK